MTRNNVAVMPLLARVHLSYVLPVFSRGEQGIIAQVPVFQRFLPMNTEELSIVTDLHDSLVTARRHFRNKC